MGKIPSADSSGSAAMRGSSDSAGSVRDNAGGISTFLSGRRKLLSDLFLCHENLTLPNTTLLKSTSVMADGQGESGSCQSLVRSAGRWTVRQATVVWCAWRPRIIWATPATSQRIFWTVPTSVWAVSLRTPLEAGASLVIRTNLDPKRANVPRRVLVNWCEEKPDGTFQAGLEFM